MSAPMYERRPSAGSIRNKRSSTFGDGSSGVPVHDPMPANAGYLAAPGGYSAQISDGQAPARPPMRAQKSSDGARSRGGSTPGAADNSKVGAILLNKRQSVSFGKAQAAAVRAGVRPDVAPPLPTSSSRQLAPQQGPGRPHLHGSHGRPMTAGEELVASAQKGPGGMPLNDLLKEDFITELCMPKQAIVKSHLTTGAAANPNAQLEDLRRLKNALSGLLSATQSNFQSNVIANYTEFIQVSKDIAALESEMLELKSVLEEWKTVPEGLAVEQSFDAAAPSQNGGFAHASGAKVNRRNSLADLQALYRTQLETLWEAVEGAQRFLPMTPGRHVLGRHAGWIELNSATYRPRQQVILILLNDALLVAIEKRRQMGGATRIVADRCFILNEIAVTDLRDTGDVTNAIRIKRDREVHIFRNEKAEDKKALLSAFKKILEDTMQKRRKQSVWEAEHRRDQIGSSGRRMSEIEAPQKSALASFRPATIFPFLGGDYPSGKDLGWIDDVCDKLATLMALRDFEEAIAIIEAAKSIYATVAAEPLAEQLLRDKIDQRSRELCSILLATLADPSIRKAGVVRHSSWLLRLGQGERARDTFLASRGNILKQRASEIVFASQQDGFAGGNPTAISQALVSEIAQLSFVCFAVVRNTSDWYMAAYQDPHTASAFVKWATSQVEVFAGEFKRHVYMTALPKSNATIQQCHDVAIAHSQVLKEVGLDFAFLLQQALVYTPPALPLRNSTTSQDNSPVDTMDHIDEEPVQPLSFRKRPPAMPASEGLS